MGYSARYHVASLAAVFLALGVGLLLGAGFGDEVVSGTAENLEQSLQGDLDDANAKIADLEADVARQARFADAVYPALAAGTLVSRDLALVGLGGSPEPLRENVIEALEPTGAEVTQQPVVRELPDLSELAELLPDDGDLSEARAERAAARRAGRALVAGTGFYDDARQTLLTSFSGEVGALDGVILVRDAGGGQDDADADAFEEAFVEGLVKGGVPVVGVERTDSDPSSIGFFIDRGLTTVDDLDLPAGRVAMVYALRGAQGNFGVGERAEELVPAVLRRVGATAGQ
jgi:hypothetical protein